MSRFHTNPNILVSATRIGEEKAREYQKKIEDKNPQAEAYDFESAFANGFDAGVKTINNMIGLTQTLVVNVNNIIYVTLTQRGAEVLNARNHKEIKNLDEAGLPHLYLRDNWKEGEIYKEQFWKVIDIFKDCFVIGSEVPFEKNVIRIPCESYNLDFENKVED